MRAHRGAAGGRGRVRVPRLVITRALEDDLAALLGDGDVVGGLEEVAVGHLVVVGARARRLVRLRARREAAWAGKERFNVAST